MKGNGNKVRFGVAVHAVFLALYVVAFLIVPFPKTAPAWLSFVFTAVAIIGSGLVYLHAFHAEETLVSKVYGFPVFRVGAVYMLAQFAIGVMVCIIASFVALPFWLVLLVYLILLCAAAIGVLATDRVRVMAAETDERLRIDTQNMSGLAASAFAIADRCQSAVLKPELEKLYEQLRFSDPVSNAATLEKENELKQLLTELSAFVEENNESASRAAIRSISHTVAERNMLCKLHKGE